MTDSPAIMEWAKTQIDQCKQNHKACSLGFISKTDPPSRLIDVSGSAPAIHLVMTQDLPKGKPFNYIALSHCWGGPRNYRLTEENFSIMIESIAIEKLSKNFCDAITITQNLDIQYLWIDSLCIIQDNHEDWKRESKNMGQYYANAICVLSATAAPDSNGGCIFPKTRLAGGCTLREQGDSSLDVESERLTKRGWCFQERVLGSRILHFCSGLVLFECNMVQAASSGEDKIIAIYGVAKFIAQRTKLTFVAGMWKEMVPFDLLWKLDKPLVSRPPDRRIPSWSWASVDGKVLHLLQETHNETSTGSWEDSKLHVRECSFQEIEGLDPPIQSGKLRLQGSIFAFHKFKLGLHFAPDIELSPLQHKSCVCLAIFSFKNARVYPYCRNRQLHGLVLQAEADSTEGYRRVGHFWTADKTVVGDILRHLLELPTLTIKLF
ncbi:heterokaryon incompatibility protein-domain-containing protein [Phaeosphaeriaceae sp. PMI808]|nr:heterokaryon incompatibility protein-domain-containing protein [Phaeosphaeriaceae sp. PMI808]